MSAIASSVPWNCECLKTPILSVLPTIPQWGLRVPASVGAQLSMPNKRPLVIVGDGAFQMTGTELSTIVRYGLNPIVVVLNNHGYGTERHLLEGAFNDYRMLEL